MSNDNPQSRPARSPARDMLASGVGVLVLLGFAYLVYYMLGRTADSDAQWIRAIYIFNGVEGIAFAAAGFLFGHEVQRRRADNAEQRAETAQVRATTEATKGKVVAEAIRARGEARRPATDGGVRPEGMRERATSGVAAEDLTDLVALVNRLYP